MIKKRILFIFLFYLLLAVIYTFPLIIKLSSGTYGYSGDNLGAMHYFKIWKEAKLNGDILSENKLEEFPFGVKIDHESQAFLYYFPIKVLTLFTNEVVAYNLVIILSFPLAAISMCLFVFYLTRNLFVSFLSGFLFAFSPYMFFKAYNHLDLALIWPIPLYAWSLIRLLKESSNAREYLKRLVTAGFCFALIILTNLYLSYFMFLFSAFYVLVSATLAVKNKFSFAFRFLLRSSISGVALFAISMLLVLPFSFETIMDSVYPDRVQSKFLREAHQRPLINLVSLSARPWDYFIPAQDNPIFGRHVPEVYRRIRGLSNDFKTISGPVHERTIYLGVIPIIFTIIFILIYIRNPIFRERFGTMPLVLFIVSLLLVVASLPPYFFVKGKEIRLFSYYLYQFFPMFRAYSRLGIVVLLCVVSVFGMTLTYLIERIGEGRYRKIILSFFLFSVSLIAVLDFLNVPPSKVISFGPTPSAYLWLKDQPGNGILEWPPSFNITEGFYYQNTHQKGIANWSSQSAYYPLWDAVRSLSTPKTAGILNALGVDFVVVHKKLLFPQENPTDDLWYTRAVSDPKNFENDFPGLKLVFRSEDINVFKVEETISPIVITIAGSLENADIRYFGDKLFLNKDFSGEIYLYNFVNSVKTLDTKLNLNFNGDDPFLGGVLYLNGEKITPQFGGLEFSLLNGENILLYVANSNYKKSNIIRFSDITLNITPQ